MPDGKPAAVHRRRQRIFRTYARRFSWIVMIRRWTWRPWVNAVSRPQQQCRRRKRRRRAAARKDACRGGSGTPALLPQTVQADGNERDECAGKWFHDETPPPPTTTKTTHEQLLREQWLSQRQRRLRRVGNTRAAVRKTARRTARPTWAQHTHHTMSLDQPCIAAAVAAAADAAAAWMQWRHG